MRLRRAFVLTVAAFAVLAASAGAAEAPLTLVWPTSVELEPGGTLLVVENGLHRVVRVDPKTGRATTLTAAVAKPYAVARAKSGALFVTDAAALKRIDGTGPPRGVAKASEEIGPIAFAANGDLYFATATTVYRLAGGAGKPVTVAGTGAQGSGGDGGPATAASFSGPHGLAVAPGVLLVSDTGNNRVRRIDLKTGVVTTLMKVTGPRGIDVAPDGSIYVVEAGARRVGHFSAAGKRLGFAGPRFGDPYDLDAGPAGVYVLDTAESGTIKRIAPNGAVTTLAAG